MRDNAKGVSAFLVLVFGLAWALWAVPLWLGVSAFGGLMRLLVIPGTFAPAIAAIVVRKWVTREGFADAGLRPHFRKWPYYVAAWVISLVVVGFVAWTAPLAGVAQPQVSTAQAAAIPYLSGSDPAGILTSAVFVLTLGAVLSTPIIWGEEFGWRSYLQLRLFPSRPLLAAVATGLIWGVWHYPLLLAAPEIPEHTLATLAIFPAGTVLYSILFGWLRIRSGSIWPSSFAHSCINHVRSPLLALLFPALADKLPLVLLGMVALLGLSIVVVAAGGLRAPNAAPQS